MTHDGEDAVFRSQHDRGFLRDRKHSRPAQQESLAEPDAGISRVAGAASGEVR